jgi:hypothetical protein
MKYFFNKSSYVLYDRGHQHLSTPKSLPQNAVKPDVSSNCAQPLDGMISLSVQSPKSLIAQRYNFIRI